MIRAVVPADAQPVAALIRAAYQGYVPALGRHPQPMDDNYAELIAAGQVSVLEEGDDVIGVLVVQPQDYGDMLIRTVGIAPGHQGKGLGTRLMAHAEAIAGADDRTRLSLYTNEVMQGTARLYERLGYRETHRTGPEGRQVIYMAKKVPLDRTPWYDVIVTDADICFGKARIAGTRIYVDLLLACVEGEMTMDDILEAYPGITRDQVKAAFGFARDLVAAKRNRLKGDPSRQHAKSEMRALDGAGEKNA